MNHNSRKDKKEKVARLKIILILLDNIIVEIAVFYYGSTTLKRRFCATGNIADRPRSGRSRVITAADDHFIVMQHLCNRRLTAAATGRQYGIHAQTVRNRLRQNVQPICAY